MPSRQAIRGGVRALRHRRNVARHRLEVLVVLEILVTLEVLELLEPLEPQETLEPLENLEVVAKPGNTRWRGTRRPTGCAAAMIERLPPSPTDYLFLYVLHG